MKMIKESTASISNLNIIVSEKLYDLQGKNSFNTVPVAKGQGATHANSIGFETAFVTSRNPQKAQKGDFWRGGQMSGLVTQWLDTAIFSSQDVPYPYTGSYYENNPTSRLDKTSSLGAQFKEGSPYTPEYSYGQYQELPREPKQTLEITTNLNKIFPELNTYQVENFYAINASQLPLNNKSYLTNITVQEFSGQAGVELTLDSQNNYLLSNTTYQVNPSIGQNGLPIVQQRQYNLPNTYDNSGNILSDNKPYFKIIVEIDALGRMTYGESSDWGATLAYYDQGGLLRFTQDATQSKENVCLYYTYDGLGRITSIYGLPLDSWDVTTLQAYLSGSLPENQVLIRRYTYDLLPKSTTLTNTQGRLVMAESWNITASLESNPSSYVTEVYSYNSLGQVQSLKVTYNTQNPVTTNYTYTNLGQLQTVTYPFTIDSPSIIGVLYTYNIQGKIANVGQLNSNYQNSIVNYYASYTYNPNGSIATEAFNQGQITRSYSYNILGQLTGISDDQSYFTENLSYTNEEDNTGNYQDGNVQQASYAFNYGDSSSKGYSYQYTYDSFGRLVNCQSSDQSMPNWGLYAADSTGNYDANGNVWGAQGVLNTYNAMTNQLLSRGDNGNAYTYDDSGRVVTISQGETSTYALTYDTFKSRPITINETAQSVETAIIYNQAGERVSKSTANMTIQYYRLGAQVLQESVTYTTSKNVYQLSYVYGPLGLIATNINQTTGSSNYNGTYFMLKDDLGSIRSVYNSSTLDIDAYMNYSPWGEIVPGNSTDNIGEESDMQLASFFRYLYTGQEWDPDLSLYSYHARQYDPTLGRFLSPDPAHQTPSPYLYCANNPVNYTDPTGKMIYLYLGKEESANPGLAELNNVLKNIASRMNANVQYANHELVMGEYNVKSTLFSAIRNLETHESVYIGFHFNPDGNISLPQKINVVNLAKVLNEKISKTPGYEGSVYLLACGAGSEESHYFTQLRSLLNFDNPVYASPYKLNADMHGLFGKAEGFEEQFERVKVLQDRLNQASIRLTQEQTKLGNSIITRSQSTNISININNLRAEIGQLQAEVKEASKLLSSLMIRDANLLWKKI